MPRKYPEHFRLPTDSTLKHYKVGREAGLVDAGDEILRSFAEDIPVDDIRHPAVQAIDARLRRAARMVDDAGYPVEGLSAVQIGEAVRMSLVTAPAELRDPAGPDRQYLTIINGTIKEVEGAPMGDPTPHGCHSMNEVFTKLQVPDQHILTGYNLLGEPVSYDRSGFETDVDWHELWHEAGRRAGNIAMEEDVQLDWRPPELKQAYRDFFGGEFGFGKNPDLPDWALTYAEDQYQALEMNEFRLADFLRE